MPEVARTLLYGLFAAASPIVLLATLVVVGSGRGRANGTAFTLAFLLGQSVAFLGAFFVGSALRESEHRTATSYIELAAGVALLVIAVRGRPPHEPPEGGSSARTEALFARLERLTPRVSFGIGFPLGIGVKRLAITILAAATIALVGLSPGEEVGLGALYVVAATLIVWVPVALYLILGTRADDLMAHARIWITAHEQMLTFVTALALCVFFLIDGLIRLVP
jgi:hypothetical protein